MPVTTVKVDTGIRDRLVSEARREGRTVGQLLDTMLAERERALRFARLKDALAATPAAELESWRTESQLFEVTSADGLDAS